MCIRDRIITVHDELIMEVPEANVKVGAELLVSTMKRVGHSLIAVSYTHLDVYKRQPVE